MCCVTRRARCWSSRSPRASSSRRPDRHGFVYAHSMKAVVIGCGRVGSNVAVQLAAEGWDVTCLDEKEEALMRLGSGWHGRFVVGHGMDIEVLHEAGIEDA